MRRVAIGYAARLSIGRAATMAQLCPHHSTCIKRLVPVVVDSERDPSC